MEAMEESGAAAPHPIAGADTSTTAIVAAADAGPLHEPVICTSVADFSEVFGPVSASPLGQAVADHFANGGVAVRAVRATDVRRALAALSGPERFPLLVVHPDLLVPGDLAEADVVCEERRAFLVADADPGGHVPPELTAAGARNAAVYFPRILDEAGRPRSVAAAVAGVFARNDHTRGVWRASAGTSAQVVGAVDVETHLTERQLAALSGRQVNALRRMPDGTVVIWGDRTVAPDPEWKYVNVRRHLLYLEHSIEDALQWVATEPNAEPLWEQVRRDVGAFLDRGWRHGEFPGARPSEAFWVRCDPSTMTPEDVAAGRLVVLVGVATIEPGQFVTVRVALRSGAPVSRDPTATAAVPGGAHPSR